MLLEGEQVIGIGNLSLSINYTVILQSSGNTGGIGMTAYKQKMDIGKGNLKYLYYVC